MEKQIPSAVTTKIDRETGLALLEIETALELKPAAVARLGLRQIIPQLVREAMLKRKAAK